MIKKRTAKRKKIKNMFCLGCSPLRLSSVLLPLSFPPSFPSFSIYSLATHCLSFSPLIFCFSASPHHPYLPPLLPLSLTSPLPKAAPFFLSKLHFSSLSPSSCLSHLLHFFLPLFFSIPFCPSPNFSLVNSHTQALAMRF